MCAASGGSSTWGNAWESRGKAWKKLCASVTSISLVVFDECATLYLVRIFSAARCAGFSVTEIGNRKERLRVREAGASAAGRGQRPYASFPEWQPHHNPSLQTHHPIITLSVGYCTGAGGFLRVNKMMNVMLPSLPAYISRISRTRDAVFS